MKIFQKRMMATLLATTALLSVCGCNNEESSSDSIPVEPVMEMTEFKLLDEGKSDYKIVISDQATENEKYSANELQYYFRDATAVTLPIVNDTSVSYTVASKYIVVGETDLNSAAGLVVDKDGLKESGVNIQTKGGSVFLTGGSRDGIIYAAYEFLGYTLGFEVYAGDEWAFDPYNPNIFMPAFETTVIPDFDVRSTSWNEVISDSNYLKLMRYVAAEDTNDWLYAQNWCHTNHVILPASKYAEEHPDWYDSTQKQLCYNNEEMTEEFIRVYLNDYLAKNQTATKGMLGIYDDPNSYCKCDVCKLDPTPSTSYVKFGNKVAAAIKEAYPERDFRPVLLVYEKYDSAPVTETEEGEYVPNSQDVIPADNLGIYFCTWRCVDYVPLNHEENLGWTKKIEGWAAITKPENLFVWHYDNNFANQMVVYNNFDTVAQDYKFLADIGYRAIFAQGARENSAAFSELKIYLQSKLMWNTSLDINELIDRFMLNYYQDAGALMGEYLDELRAHFEIMRVEKDLLPSTKGSNIADVKYWPYQRLVGWMKKFDVMFETIEKYKTSDPDKYQLIYDRIDKQRLSLEYLLIVAHGSEYSEQELLEMRLALKEGVQYHNIKNMNEATTFASIWESWGID